MTPQEKRAHEYAKRASLCPGEFDARFEGYLQAEKDLALTPEDIKLITKIHYEIVFKDTTGIKVGDVAEEVLRRFNKQRKK